MEKIMSTLTKKQQECIKDNLRAYTANFDYIRIERADYGGGFYVYTDESSTYTQFCYNIHYLNGWLYGAVQAVNGRMTRRKEEENV